MYLIEEKSTRLWISLIHTFLKCFGWLADSFVLNFYHESHWKRLPKSWQEYLPKLSGEELAVILDVRKCNWDPVLKRGHVPPLGLLALVSSIKVLSIQRKQDKLEENFESKTVTSAGFKKMFTRHVKPKKRHEIEHFSKIVTSICDKASTNCVFDVGSGVGHLARYLSYGCHLNMTCVDSVDKYGHAGTKFDEDLKRFLVSKKDDANFASSPTHLCLTLELNKHENHFVETKQNFGIIGLHTCGNLGPVIIHNYVNSKAKFVVSVGCCYMKLDSLGFPLSKYGESIDLKLSYEALEVSCHAIEQYCQRLEDGRVSSLMTHAYRSVLETILINSFGIRRAGLKGVRNCEKISFQEYAHRATINLENVTLNNEQLCNKEIFEMLKDWYKVVVFYSLRVLIANLIETLVILDRALFIKENVSGSVKIVSLFDPIQSPRNFAIVGERNE